MEKTEIVCNTCVALVPPHLSEEQRKFNNMSPNRPQTHYTTFIPRRCLDRVRKCRKPQIQRILENAGKVEERGIKETEVI
uniref:Uncharacterized protein n=1 Tax=Lepeophtheirus salmonis TaxID=72036 RepID=A0A0K2U8U2_LEPSM